MHTVLLVSLSLGLGGCERSMLTALVPLSVLTMVFALLAGFVVASRWSRPDRKLKRRMRKLPLVPFEDAKEGQLARFHGRIVQVDAPLEAPMSARACAAYQLRVVGHVGSNLTQPRIEEAKAATFVIEQGGVRAHVIPGNAELALRPDRKGSNRWFSGEEGQAFEAMIKGRGITIHGWLIRQRFSYTEAALKEGDYVMVAGRCRWESDVDKRDGYRGVGKQLRIEPLEEGVVLITDDPRLARH